MYNVYIYYMYYMYIYIYREREREINTCICIMYIDAVYYYMSYHLIVKICPQHPSPVPQASASTGLQRSPRHLQRGHPGLAWLGLAWLGLAWLGLAWIGWAGLGWAGLGLRLGLRLAPGLGRAEAGLGFLPACMSLPGITYMCIRLSARSRAFSAHCSSFVTSAARAISD